MKKLSKKGFTLIELLVVITIIGILATGVTTIYTSSQQKARDSVRVSDVAAIRTAVEQVYSDDGKYPPITDTDGNDVANKLVPTYMPSIPTDPKEDKTTKFIYVYGNGADKNDVDGQKWEVSVAFENKGNEDSKAANDDGGDDDRYETGVGLDEEAPDAGVNTQIATADGTADATFSDSTNAGRLITPSE